MRLFIMNQPGFVYMLLRVDRTCLPRNTAELLRGSPVVSWSCLLEQLRTNHSFVAANPRLVLEVHGGMPNSTRLAEQLSAAASLPPLASLGCRTTSFALIRDPLKFVSSNLHDSFKHSWFKREYAQLAQPLAPAADPAVPKGKQIRAADYRNERLHAQLPRWLPRLVDSQVRQVHVYAAGSLELSSSKAPIQHSHVAAVRAFLRTLDVVGVTERAADSLVWIIEATGFQNTLYHVAGANDIVKNFIRNHRPHWAVEEKPVLGAVANQSGRDQLIHADAMRMLDRAVAAGGAAFRCRVGLFKQQKVMVNPKRYPCVEGLVNDPRAPWARCIPVHLCGTSYAPVCTKPGEALPTGAKRVAPMRRGSREGRPGRTRRLSVLPARASSSAPSATASPSPVVAG